jgi:hypothetical protein
MGLVHSEIVEIVNFNSFGPLKSCRGRIHGRQAFTVRKTGKTLIWGVHTSHNTGGSIRSLVANDKKDFKIFTFGPIRK